MLTPRSRDLSVRSAVNREYLIDDRGDATHILLAGDVNAAALPALYRAIHRAVKVRPVRLARSARLPFRPSPGCSRSPESAKPSFCTQSPTRRRAPPASRMEGPGRNARIADEPAEDEKEFPAQ
jgi:hypothetical protein